MTRKKIRECTFSMLYCSEFHGAEESGEQTELFLNEMEEPVSKEELEMIKKKVALVCEYRPELDAAIENAAKGWSIKRMGKVETSILRLAYYEMKYDEEIPVSVAINEAVELAKQYGSDGAPAFINGILSTLAKDCE